MNDKAKHNPLFRASFFKATARVSSDLESEKEKKIEPTIPTAQDHNLVESISVLRHSAENNNI